MRKYQVRITVVEGSGDHQKLRASGYRGFFSGESCRNGFRRASFTSGESKEVFRRLPPAFRDAFAKAATALDSRWITDLFRARPHESAQADAVDVEWENWKRNENYYAAPIRKISVPVEGYPTIMFEVTKYRPFTRRETYPGRGFL